MYDVRVGKLRYLSYKNTWNTLCGPPKRQHHSWRSQGWPRILHKEGNLCYFFFGIVWFNSPLSRLQTLDCGNGISSTLSRKGRWAKSRQGEGGRAKPRAALRPGRAEGSWRHWDSRGLETPSTRAAPVTCWKRLPASRSSSKVWREARN